MKKLQIEIKNEPQTTQITLRLNLKLFKKLKILADKHEISVQKVISQIVEESFKNAEIS